ncbi:hypothetical protein IF1G_01799 [Cordyceps javanica]|uniref:Uncharacterized protein n=1 Tax=Cordyceps javanica TaxID=43265 RepID=A0A545VCZ0_9HYPO|nr:hypothetical protein IF1G_01799 [Cordyceps javanica]
MDPLFLTESIVAVTNAAVQVGKVLAKIHEDWEQSLPGRMHALHDGISDLTLVLNPS